MRKFSIAILAFLFFVWFFLPQITYAQTAQNTAPAVDLNLEENVPNDFHSYTQVVFLEILSTVACQMSGLDPIHQERSCLGATGDDGKIGFMQNGGAIGFLTSGISATFEIPVSSGQYIARVFSNFGIGERVHAQNTGIGFEGLLPFLPIWEAFRNIVYLLFIVFFIIIGAGIMFQLKLDPKGAMTLQNQIPKIVIALLLITFSYAIAGFLIDLMYVAIYFSYGIVSAIPGVNVTELTPEKIQGANPITAASALADSSYGIASIASDATGAIVSVVKDVVGLGTNGGPTVADLPVIPSISGFFKNLLNNLGFGFLLDIVGKIPFGIGGAIKDVFDVVGRIPGAATGLTNFTYMSNIIHLISGVVGFSTAIKVATWAMPHVGASGGGSIIGTGASGGVQFNPAILIAGPLGIIAGSAVTVITEVILREFLPNLIAFFIIIIALFTALFRLWFVLIKAYIFLFFNIIFAPFWIAGGLIPGSSLGFGSWLRSTASNIIVFPATYVMFLLGKALLDSINTNPDTVFVPPLIGEVSSTSAGQFTALIGLGILLLTPEVVNMARSALKAPEFKGAGAIGRSLGVGTGTFSKGFGSAKNAIWHTNPQTGESERLKAWAGERAGTKADKIPGWTKMKYKFSGKAGRQKIDDARAQSDAEKKKKKFANLSLDQQADETEAERRETEAEREAAVKARAGAATRADAAAGIPTPDKPDTT